MVIYYFCKNIAFYQEHQYTGIVTGVGCTSNCLIGDAPLTYSLAMKTWDICLLPLFPFPSSLLYDIALPCYQ